MSMLKNNSIRSVFLVLISLAAALILFDSSGVGNSRTNILVLLPLVWFMYAVYKEAVNAEHQTLLLTGLLSLMWSTMTVVADKIDLDLGKFAENFAYGDLAGVLRLCVAVFPVFYWMISFCVEKSGCTFGTEKFSARNWIFVSLIYFVCWIPVFLTYYPGNLSIDSFDVTVQALGQEELSNHHPIMFTMLVRLCMKIGGMFGGVTAGIVLFSLLQMMIQAMTLGFCTEAIRRYGGKKYVVAGAIFFFGFNPIVSMYSITMWKDILFSCWLLLLISYLFDLIHGEGKARNLGVRELGTMVVLYILLAFGRNNGLYIVLLTSIVLCIYYRKQYKKVVPVFTSVVVIIAVIQGPVYDAFGIEKGSFAESVGIPLQQMAYTVKHDGYITEEQREFLDEMLSLDEMKEAYCPTLSNGIKFHKHFNDEFLEENKGEFLKVWTGMLIHNPFKFVKAYCMQTMGFWHVDTVGYIYTSGISDARYDTLRVKGENLLMDTTGIDLEVTERWDGPILNLFTMPAVPFWMILICAVVLIVRKQYSLLIVLTPLIGLWGTIMIATPAYGEFRYVYGLHLAVPFLFFLLFYQMGEK